MKVFKTIEPNKITYTPFQANKKYIITNGIYGNLPVNFLEAEYASKDKINSSEKNRYFYSIDHLYYSGYYDGVPKLANSYPFQERELHKTCNIFSVPYYIIGEGIQKHSVKLTTDSALNTQLLEERNFESELASWSIIGDATVVTGSDYRYLNITPTSSMILLYQEIENTPGDYYVDFNIKNTSNLGEFYIGFSSGSDFINTTITNSTQSFVYDNSTDLYFATITLQQTSSLFGLYHSSSAASVLNIENFRLHKIDNSVTLRDDGNGNLYNTTYKTTLRPLRYKIDRNKKLHLKFHDSYRTGCKIPNRDYSEYRNHGIGVNVDYVQKVNGYAAKFSNTTFNTIKVKNIQELNPGPTDDFGIGAFITIPYLQTDTNKETNVIIAKNGRTYQTIPYSDKQSMVLDNIVTNDTTLGDNIKPINLYGPYPYKLEIYNSSSAVPGYLKASMFDGMTEYSVTSSTPMNDDNMHHIWFQKTGSAIELFIDGVFDASQSIPVTDLRISNDSYLFIGSNGDETQNLNGIVHEVLFTSGALDSSDIVDYYAFNASTDYCGMYDYNVGNVFYEHGIITITDPNKTYDYIGRYDATTTSSLGSYELTLKNTVNKTEVEIICTAESGEFNKSLNPSAIYDETNPILKSQTYATHSQFKPYVTTIGLYNDSAQLLAVAKTSIPVKRIDGMDTNFICKFDID